ncbi:hypothetical protein DFH11DRAFT_1732139 [Phellopilus nigrolimitatus]|nr:hypothetical protein DFH11DRAFT_1732139 [Phellopilus nigrolimitatus]
MDVDVSTQGHSYVSCCSTPEDTAVIMASIVEACLPVIGALLWLVGSMASRPRDLSDPRDSGGELGFGSGDVQQFTSNTPAQIEIDLSAFDADRVVRPAFGKCRGTIAVRANVFALKYPQDEVLYDNPRELTHDVISTITTVGCGYLDSVGSPVDRGWRTSPMKEYTRLKEQ